jgi:hypothetical protein
MIGQIPKGSPCDNFALCTKRASQPDPDESGLAGASGGQHS